MGLTSALNYDLFKCGSLSVIFSPSIYHEKKHKVCFEICVGAVAASACSTAGLMWCGVGRDFHFSLTFSCSDIFLLVRLDLKCFCRSYLEHTDCSLHLVYNK